MTSLYKFVRKLYDYVREFGTNCFIAVYLSRLYSYHKHKNKLSWILLQNKHKAIKKYLFLNYYNNEAVMKEYTINCISKEHIWTAWLQGEERAPEVVRLSLASIRRNSNGHQVIVLSDKNIENYIKLPEMIKNKYNAGTISNAHYTDIIRMMILKVYGGVWLDATMYLHEPIDERAFRNSFFSFGFQNSNKTRFISEYKWIVGIIGGQSNSVFLSQISKMLTNYWLDHDVCIDYFVFDYLIAVLYENDQDFANQVDSLPRMKFNTNKLREIIDRPYSKELLDAFMIHNQVYYLTYKRDYRRVDEQKLQTVYGFLCSQLLEC